MQKKILLTLLITFLPSLASAEEGFPFNYEAKVKPKNFSVNLFYSDNSPFDNKTGTSDLRAEVKANFLNDEGSGIISEISYQHMFGTNPSIISGIIPPGDNAYSFDSSALIGYRFPFFDNVIGISPFLKGRGVVTRGRGGDNIYGPEIGANIEWKIYPETTHLNVRYGLMIPVLHNYTGSIDTVKASSFLLSNFEARLSYRFLPNFDAIVGYQLRAFPKNLGNSNLATSDLLLLNGVLLGVGYLF